MAVLVTGTALVVFRQVGGVPAPRASCAGGCAGTTPRKALPSGPKLKYRTVHREVGYFEGTVTIVNPGSRSMRAWTLSFTYPGADIHLAWDAVITQKGQNVVLVNTPSAAAIPPGGSFTVQFGGAGRPAMPTACRLNNAPCTFVQP